MGCQCSSALSAQEPAEPPAARAGGSKQPGGSKEGALGEAPPATAEQPPAPAPERPPPAEPPERPPPALQQLRPAPEAQEPRPAPESQQQTAADAPPADADADPAAAARSSGAYRFLPELIQTQPEEFSAVTMNILAADLGRPKTHGYCSPEHLAWEGRRRRLLEGLLRALPDVIFMQEVQGTFKPHKSDHFGDLKGALAEAGYFAGAFVRLTASNGEELGGESSKTQSQKRAHIGNAVFARSAVWEHLGQGRLAFAQLLAARCAAAGLAPSLCERYTEGQQVAAWARLRHKASGLVVVAVSVHVSAHYRTPDQQLAQVDTMLRHLCEEVLQEGDALLIGGDFNSTPGSSVHHLLSQGELPADCPDLRPPPGAVGDESPALLHDAAGLRAPDRLRGGLRSAYATLQGVEPELTTAVGLIPPQEGSHGFSGTLDYIWYSANILEPVAGSLLATPSTDEARAEGGGLPNSEVPSDHVPLGATFRVAESAAVVGKAGNPQDGARYDKEIVSV